VRILPLDAGTCTCGNVLPVDPRATRGPPSTYTSRTHSSNRSAPHTLHSSGWPQQCSRHRRPAPSAATSDQAPASSRF